MTPVVDLDRGVSRSQIGPSFRGQRGWKGQPDGGAAGLGGGSSSRMVATVTGRGSEGTAESSASVSASV